MKAWLLRWFERRWYGGVPPNALLRALESMVARAVTQRRREFLYGADEMMRVGMPVVVIGNLTVGGAGKTPLTIALVEALRARGLRPGVVSRGYGRRGNALRRVSADDRAQDVGDEPLLIARRTGVPIAVAAMRFQAARLLERAGDVDVLIADDGLQHYTLMRDIEILVIDGRRGFGNARLIPAGPLREPLERGTACEFTVINRGAGPLLGQSSAGITTIPGVPPVTDAIDMTLMTGDAVSLSDGGTMPLAQFAGQRVHAVAAIADPERFFNTLRQHGIEPVPHAFPDHHAFAEADLVFDDSLPVLMTEKDAVKCAGFACDRMYSVPVSALLPQDFLDRIATRIRQLATQVESK